MGELYIEKPNGEAMTIQIDGTIIKEQAGMNLDRCDKCEKWKPKDHGAFESYQGLTLWWFCEGCK